MHHLACARCGARNAEFDPRCSRCGAELPQVSASAPAAAAVPEDSLLGHSFGAYRLLEPLGRGGMGQVYRARHLGSRRLVAIKTVSVPTAGMLDGLRREVRALSRLRHPGIVRILEQGVEDGLPWYAMQLLRGPTLRASSPWQAIGAETAGEGWWTRSLTAGPRSGTPIGGPEQPGRPVILAQPAAPLHEMLTLMRRLCAALAYLHGEGLVHGDLKPENILVVKSGAGSPLWPVIVDFGLSAAFAGARGREALEVGGAAAGTAAYMPPEQILGEPLDARADLYSLGCILYELLTGRRPFSGPSVREMLRAHLYQSPAPPSQLVPGLPAGVDRLILRLLAKKPRERLGHAFDVAAALAELGADEAPTPRAPLPRAYLYRPALAGRKEPLSRLEQQLVRLVQDARSGGLTLVGGESGVGKTSLLVELSRRAAGRGIQVLAGECLPGVASSEPPVARAQHSDSSSLGSRESQLVSVSESAHAPRGRSDRSPSASTGGAVALEALRKPLQSVADRCREGGPAEAERLLGRRGKVLAQYEPALRGLPGQESYPEPADLPADAARLRLFDYLAETFEALAEAPSPLRMPPAEAGEGSSDRAAPLLLILDDLQWADELTLGFLDYWLRVRTLGSRHPTGTTQAAPTPLLVVGTYRSEEVGATVVSPLQRLTGTAGVESISLGRLEEEAVGEMVGDMLALEPPPALFVRHLARHSEGNPFFVAEYLRAAIDQGLLYRDSRGQWQVAEEDGQAATEATYEGLGLPRSLQELVRSRLRGLGPDARKLLQSAAVLGRETDAELLQRMAMAEGEHGRALFLDAVNELLRRQVLEVPAPGRLRFVHDKIREAAYATLRKPQRKKLHRAAAESIESVHAGALEDHQAALGRHWEQAGEPDKARPCYLAAARQAKARGALSEARQAYESYLSLVETPSSESIDTRSEMGYHVLRLQGLALEWIHECRTGLEEAREIGDVPGEIKTLRRLSQAFAQFELMDEARETLSQGLALARQTADQRSESFLLALLGYLEEELGRWDQAEAFLSEALTRQRADGIPADQVFTLHHLASIHSLKGRPQDARELFEQQIEISRAIGDRDNEAAALGELGNCCLQLCQFQEAHMFYDQALALCREIGHQANEAAISYCAAELHLLEGQLDTAQDLLEQALRWFERSHNLAATGLALQSLGRLERWNGRLERADQQLQAAEALHRQIRNPLAWADSLIERAHLMLARQESPRKLMDECKAILAKANISPDDEVGSKWAQLQRAVVAFDAGHHHRLLRGELLEDLPEGLRRLAADGLLPAPG